MDERLCHATSVRIDDRQSYLARPWSGLRAAWRRLLSDSGPRDLARAGPGSPPLRRYPSPFRRTRIPCFGPSRGPGRPERSALFQTGRTIPRDENASPKKLNFRRAVSYSIVNSSCQRFFNLLNTLGALDKVAHRKADAAGKARGEAEGDSQRNLDYLLGRQAYLIGLSQNYIKKEIANCGKPSERVAAIAPYHDACLLERHQRTGRFLSWRLGNRTRPNRSGNANLDKQYSREQVDPHTWAACLTGRQVKRERT